ARIQAHRAGIKIHTGLVRTRNPGASLVEEALRIRADVIYWSTLHAPAGEQRIGPTAAYLLSKRPCRVIIETENRPAAARQGAAGFNCFHLPPGGRFDLADERDWVALLVFVIVAVATGLVAEVARARSHEAEQRRQEAALAAEMARLLLGPAHLEEALELSAVRLATAIGVGSAAIALGGEQADDGSLA